MSSLLYRLGRWCATHAWRTIAIWLAVLTGVGALAGTVGQPLSSSISVPGTEFERVLDRLGDEIPEAAGGFGTVVLGSEGDPFTAAQRRAVEDVLAAWAEVPSVERVVDPFDAQDRLDASAAELDAARTELEDGERRLAAGRAELTAAQGQLSGGEALVTELVGRGHNVTTFASGDSAVAGRLAPTVERALRPLHGQATPVRHDGTGLFSGLPDPMAVARYHSLIVSPEPGMEERLAVNALSAEGEIMALSHRRHPTWGIQFHPESVLTEGGHAIFSNFLRLARAWREGRGRMPARASLDALV